MHLVATAEPQVELIEASTAVNEVCGAPGGGGNGGGNGGTGGGRLGLRVREQVRCNSQVQRSGKGGQRGSRARKCEFENQSMIVCNV